MKVCKFGVLSDRDLFLILDAPIAQLDRASDYGSEGWGFDSSWAYLLKAIDLKVYGLFCFGG